MLNDIKVYQSGLAKNDEFIKKAMMSIILKYYESTSAQLFTQTQEYIRKNLRKQGIDFEGKELPISLLPTLLIKEEIDEVAKGGYIIRQVLNKLICKFIKEHKQKQFNGCLHKFFKHYENYWDIIGNENRKLPYINLMRYDAVRTINGQYKFMETNTACPGGVINCSLIRKFWMATDLANNLMKNVELSSFPIDDASSFVLFLVKQAQKISNTSDPNIAICNYKGFYTNELTTLFNQHKKLVAQGVIPGGRLILCDIRDIVCDGDQAYVGNLPISIIYNKIDQLMINPKDPTVQGWVGASQCSGTEFLNSLGAIYLTEAKRSLAFISDPSIRTYLDLTIEEEEAIDKYIPFTRSIPERNSTQEKDLYLKYLLNHQRFQYVLKADSLTRGEGIFIGNQLSRSEWNLAIESTRKHNGVIQHYCNLPQRENFILTKDETLTEIDEFFGIDFFYFGEEFSGIVSRSHTSKIFNVGNGGKESPVVVIA